MIEAIISSLLVAAVTGLTIIAYRHPRAFSKLFTPILVVTGAALASGLIWDVAVSRAFVNLSPFVDTGKLQPAQNAIEALSPPMGWLIGGFFGFYMYLVFLLNLPKLLSQEGGDSNQKE
ncbi:hypothetical protein [Marinobacter daepoensis]|uniref:hypothetical protein n=1 Tax=Marinobacter daepoensis TaxID=262077 RepID=UPI0004A30669|nr:hypothetical protein [Marinobacter daepoensis]